MSLMDRILELHGQTCRMIAELICLNGNGIREEADSDVVCQPGVSYMDLNDHLKKKGTPLFVIVAFVRCSPCLPQASLCSFL